MANSTAERLSDAQDLDAFHRLVQDLSDVLGPSSGLDSADVDPQDIERLMIAYKSNPGDWLQYAWGDSSRPYTRNLVDEGNGKSNLVGHRRIIVGLSLTLSTADPRMDSWQSKSGTRSCQCTLCDEGESLPVQI